ncbi:MAG: dihydroorotate dehydrogenase [Candidatus Paceibacterota bacterium]|jgi:dihydroorotate dehydrogenase (fumarate)
MNFETTLAGIPLEHPLMNAAGTCRLLEEVSQLARSATAAIMVGSITMEPRQGNGGNVYWVESDYSLNSLGLPNRGIEYYGLKLPAMVAEAHAHGKPLFVSIAGFSAEEYAIMSKIAFAGGADMVELNLGCPNVWQGGMQKRIACFDPVLVANILRQVETWVGAEAKIACKVSPYSDPFQLAQVAEVIGKSKLVKAVTTVNTFPNAFGLNGEAPRITPAGGLAGMAGPALKPIGLGQVRQLRALLPSTQQLIGVGGIIHSTGVREYILAGASAVQIATAYLERGETIFSSILSELTDE